MKRFHTFSSNETRKLGIDLGRKLLRARLAPHATVVALRGDLGSGKTVFVGGILNGLGLRARAVSPTFILMRRFSLRRGLFQNAYHFDCYRLRKPRELGVLGFKEIIAEPKNIVLVEWAERTGRFLPKRRLDVQLKHTARENERTVRLRGAL